MNHKIKWGHEAPRHAPIMPTMEETLAHLAKPKRKTGDDHRHAAYKAHLRRKIEREMRMRDQFYFIAADLDQGRLEKLLRVWKDGRLGSKAERAQSRLERLFC